MEVKIEGQVVHIRKSEDQKIAFFDIEPTLLGEKTKDSEEGPEPLPQKMCIVLKSSNCGEDVLAKAVKTTSQRIHVGDVVAFVGAYEDKTTFGAKSFEVLSRGKKGRARVFAEWILTKYGRDYFEEGLILDIGGGRGDLAFELATRQDIDCAVVDRRPSKLRSWQTSYHRKHPEARVPKHYQAVFTPDFLEAQDISLTSVKLIVGLHPDEATEPIVATALALDLPFAVIPCCVFAASFPLRRLKDGSSPSSYEEFLTYLKEKDAGIQEEILSFSGKNTVLFKNS